MYEARVLHRFKCKYSGRIYEPGDIYRHESEARMDELASRVPPRIEWPPRRAEPEIAGEPRYVGGGWYELPDGRRVQGREAAVAALRGEHDVPAR